jgi:WD repeat-containing protein 1 (actin-interacting protein 1)
VLGGDPKGKNFLYAHGNSVIIRNIDVSTSLTAWGIPQLFKHNLCDSFFQDPSISETYTEHSCQVNVAKYSPSGFYIASAGIAYL